MMSEMTNVLPAWVPVETALPRADVPVWLYELGRGMWIGARTDGGEGWLWGVCVPIYFDEIEGEWLSEDIDVDDDYRPTHWRPLPSPPPGRTVVEESQAIERERAEGWGPEDCYPETTADSKSESSDLLSAFRQVSAEMAVLFARKKIQESRVGGQAVGMETYRLIFTGSELGSIWRRMEELEELVKQVRW